MAGNTMLSLLFFLSVTMQIRRINQVKPSRFRQCRHHA